MDAGLLCESSPRDTPLHFPQTNLLLEALPPEAKPTLMSQLEAVTLPVNTVLFEAGVFPRYAHFVTSGIASVVTSMSGGDAVEVGLVGREGFAEKFHLLGPEVGEVRCFIQVAGTALRMDFKRFEKEFVQNAALHRLVLRNIQYDAMILAQLGACNRLHEVEERLARWLLMVQDRTGESDLKLTQEFLGEMLGARRSTVNLALGSLQRSGLIESRRSHICIESRDALAGIACECYPILLKGFQNLYK